MRNSNFHVKVLSVLPETLVRRSQRQDLYCPAFDSVELKFQANRTALLQWNFVNVIRQLKSDMTLVIDVAACR
jgi:hypothetical protein